MTKRQKKIYDFLVDKQGYLKKSASFITDLLEERWNKTVNSSDVTVAINEIKKSKVKPEDSEDKTIVVNPQDKISEDKAEELIETVEAKKPKKPKVRRLFFDIETSPNVVFSWSVGYKLQIPPENILKERAIICICYKWAGESKVHSLHWDNGDDKAMLEKFIEVLNTADEIIGHNSDQYDIKWIRTRCIYHGITMFPDYTQIDTIKLAKIGFRFNSNKLDYIGGFLGVGNKMHVDFSTWKSIVLDNDEKAMEKMEKYCKVDVIRLQQIYDKLNVYSKYKTHVGVLLGNDKCSCPNCGGDNHYHQGKVVSAAGVIKHRMQCKDCLKYYRVTHSEYEKSLE